MIRYIRGCVIWIWATDGFHIAWGPLAWDLMAYISEATMNWHVQHWFSHSRCNIASFKCKNNFLTRGCNRSSKKYMGPGLFLSGSLRSWHFRYKPSNFSFLKAAVTHLSFLVWNLAGQQFSASLGVWIKMNILLNFIILEDFSWSLLLLEYHDIPGVSKKYTKLIKRSLTLITSINDMFAFMFRWINAVSYFPNLVYSQNWISNEIIS